MVKIKYQNGTTATIVEFRELRLVELPEVERAQSITLRKRRVDHRLGIWRTWSMSVTTEGDVNDVLEIVNFWNAESRWIQSPYASGDTNWIAVTTAGGRCPITYVDDILEWPEFTIELFAKEPS